MPSRKRNPERKSSTEQVKIPGIFKMMGEPVTLERILEEQFQLHGPLQVQDAYNLVYSGVFGSFNIPWKERRTSFLLQYSNAEPDAEERMIERISDLYPLCRINIRSYKAKGGDRDVLFEWFGRSTRLRCGSPKDFFSQWSRLERINREKEWFSTEEIAETRKKFMECYGRNRRLLPCDHSSDYADRNKPNYMVVSFQAIIEGLRQALLY